MFGSLLFGQGPIGITKSIHFGQWFEVISVKSEILREVGISSPVTREYLLRSDVLREVTIASQALAMPETERRA